MLKDFAKGRLKKKQLRMIFLPSVFILITCWTIAKVLYTADGGYEIDKNHISNQGNFFKNPVGAWFFALSTAYIGILLVFYMIHLYHALKPRVKVLPQLMLLTGIVGGIGLSMVAVFAEGFGGIIQEIHDFGAILAFGGLAIAGLLSLAVMICKLVMRQPWPTLVQVSWLCLLVFFFIIMILFTGSDSLIQWSGFYAVFTWLLGIFIILPEENAFKTEVPGTGSNLEKK